MRVSGNGKRPSNTGTNRKLSSSSIEEAVSKGQGNIKGVSSNAPQEHNLKMNSSNLETEKVKVEQEKIKTETKKNNPQNEKKNLEKGKNKNRKKKEKKHKKKVFIPTPIEKMSKKRIFGVVMTGLVSSTVLSGVVYGLYYNCIRYPRQMVENIETSGLGGIERWLEAINTVDNSNIKAQIGTDSFLAKEVEYANGNTNKIDFIKKMISTVEYNPKKVEAKNIYGNPMISRVDDKVVLTDSLVNGKDEEVKLKYIDYTKVPLDEEIIKKLVAENNVRLGYGDYSNNLVDIFCMYMNSLDSKDIPLVSINHVPNMVNVNGMYYMTEDEDILLDKALFSSDEFHDLLIRFSEIVAKGMENPDWSEWSKLSDKDKEGKTEPIKVLESLPTTTAWSEWNAKSDDEKKNIKEPVKYDESKVMSKSWCGSYYLLNEYKSLDKNGNEVEKTIEAEVGDGTIENPADLNTGIVTSMFVSEVDANGKTTRVAKPIKVKLIDYKVSKDALNYFESKDTRNRGYDIKSEVQYASYIFEVTNLSGETLTIYDNSSLSDGLANLAPRTGTVYGLQSSVTLKPYETGVIESWGCSTELNRKYLIWGADFNREIPVVWFRELAGDIDDPSEDKGVTLNKSRDEEDKNTEDTSNSSSTSTNEETTNTVE